MREPESLAMFPIFKCNASTNIFFETTNAKSGPNLSQSQRVPNYLITRYLYCFSNTSVKLTDKTSVHKLILQMSAKRVPLVPLNDPNRLRSYMWKIKRCCCFSSQRFVSGLVTRAHYRSGQRGNNVLRQTYIGDKPRGDRLQMAIADVQSRRNYFNTCTCHEFRVLHLLNHFLQILVYLSSDSLLSRVKKTITNDVFQYNIDTHMIFWGCLMTSRIVLILYTAT